MPSAMAMQYLILGDIHERFQKVSLIPELNSAAGFLISGDLTNIGEVYKAKQILEALRAIKPFVLAQFGNMDRPEINTWLSEENCNLHRTVWELTPDTAIFGIGGAIFTPFGTPSEFPESNFLFWLDELWNKVQQYAHTILVAHNPPYDTLCDRIAQGTHVGSKAVKEFIEEHQPDLCICGHIHESRACDRIGRTQIVNPGAFAHGNYAVLTIAADGMLSVALRRLQE